MASCAGVLVGSKGVSVWVWGRILNQAVCSRLALSLPMVVWLLDRPLDYGTHRFSALATQGMGRS